jgi:hypothetical protein
MSEEIMLPDLNEIAAWPGERCHLQRVRLRNELAFIYGDRAHGGPPREEMAAQLKSRLAAIDHRIESISSGHGRALLPRLASPPSRRRKPPTRLRVPTANCAECTVSGNSSAISTFPSRPQK